VNSFSKAQSRDKQNKHCIFHKSLAVAEMGDRLASVRADSDRPTQRPASSCVQTTVSATGVLQLPDHVCGARCQYSYGIVTVSYSLNVC